MKFTNVKQLIIKFMGGGLINFPTRFLRWIKIDGDADGNDGGDSGEGGEGGDASIDGLIDNAKNLVIKITQSGYNKVYPNEGGPYKSSFDEYENEDNFDKMISVPIENYLDISNMDVYKIIMNFVNSDLNTGRSAEIYLKRIDYHVGQNSTGSEVKILKPEFSNHCIIEYDEIGQGSGGGGSYCYFNLDPTDITKVMVYPEDA